MYRPIPETMRKPITIIGIAYLAVLALVEVWFIVMTREWQINTAEAIAIGRVPADALSLLPPAPSLIEQWGIALAMAGMTPLGRTAAAVAERRAAKKGGGEKSPSGKGDGNQAAGASAA